MRILEVTRLFEEPKGNKPNSKGKLFHGQYARDNSGKLIKLGRSSDVYVWLYDLKEMIGPSDYNPGHWWKSDITPKDEDPDVKVDTDSEEYKSALAFAMENNPRGTPDIKKITKEIQKRKPDAELQSHSATLIEYIPNNSKKGSWHRVGEENIPFNLGYAKNTKNREIVAELMWTVLGDGRFEPKYNEKYGSYDYSVSDIVKGSEVITSDGTRNIANLKRFFGDKDGKKDGVKKQNTDRFQANQAETSGVLLKHDRAYAMEGSGVKYIYQSEFKAKDPKTGEIKSITMDPLGNPGDENHQPFFLRQSDRKKVPPHSMTHALLCASLGYEADTVTRIPDGIYKKVKDWLTDQFSLYGDDLDPKAPLFTKIIKRGVYNPISKLVFGRVQAGLDNYYGTLKKAYGWQKDMGVIDESDEAKKSIVYWENKLAQLLVDVKTGRKGQTTASLLDQVQVHLEFYKKAVNDKNIEKAYRQIALNNIKNYEDILTKYYGGKFRKGQLVAIQPDKNADPFAQSGKGLDSPTINFKCSGIVEGEGIDLANNIVPFVNNQTGKMGVLIDPDTGKEITRQTRVINSVLVKLHYPELNLRAGDPQGPKGNGYYLYTGEVFALKGENTLTISKDQHENLETLRKLIQKEEEENRPNLDSNVDEQEQIRIEAEEAMGGTKEELATPIEGAGSNTTFYIEPGSDVSWKGISGKNKGKEIKGKISIIELPSTELTAFVRLTDEGKEWVTGFSLHKSRILPK